MEFVTNSIIWPLRNTHKCIDMSSHRGGKRKVKAAKSFRSVLGSNDRPINIIYYVTS